ncbi:MAG TPA: hypothetical protein V6D28_21920 [Leptolyngbyaceae cyanobacterium]
METLAYLHCASVYEDVPSEDLVPSNDRHPVFGLNGKKFSIMLSIALLPMVLGATVLGGAQEAHAYRGCGGGGYCKVSYKVRYKTIKKVRYKTIKIVRYKRVPVYRKRYRCVIPVKYCHCYTKYKVVYRHWY